MGFLKEAGEGMEGFGMQGSKERGVKLGGERRENELMVHTMA